MTLLTPPYFLALDVDSKELAEEIASQVAPFVGGFKLGPRFLLKYGVDFLKPYNKPLFFDNKYYDIPSTVVSAVQSCFDCGASFVTVHASNGKECLSKVAELERQLNSIRPFKVLVVTVLTSFSEETTPTHWKAGTIKEKVYDLVQLAVESGLSGIVCSPFEVSEIKSRFPQVDCITPGVRYGEDSKDDQKRVMTPLQAMEQGSSGLVVGRSILKADNYKLQAQKIFDELTQVK